MRALPTDSVYSTIFVCLGNCHVSQIALFSKQDEMHQTLSVIDLKSG